MQLEVWLAAIKGKGLSVFVCQQGPPLHSLVCSADSWRRRPPTHNCSQTIRLPHLICAASCHPCLWYICMFLCVLGLPVFFFMCLPLHSMCPSSLSDSSMLVSHPIKTSRPRGTAHLGVCWRSQAGSVAEPSGTQWGQSRRLSICFIPNWDIPPSEKEGKKKAATALCWTSRELFSF